MKNNYLIKVLIFILGIFNALLAASCPIIFIHGQKGGSEAKPEFAWRDWNGIDWGMPYRSAMDKILTEHYKGYTAGDPLNCSIDSTPRSTGGNTRKIYNFSYYNPDGSRGAIGGSSSIIACGNGPNGEDPEYITNIQSAQWSEHLVEFIEKVLTACRRQNEGFGNIGL